VAADVRGPSALPTLVKVDAVLRQCRILGLYPQHDKTERSFDTLVIQDPGNPGEATDADGDEFVDDVDAIPAA
jgi:hypothetical protein